VIDIVDGRGGSVINDIFKSYAMPASMNGTTIETKMMMGIHCMDTPPSRIHRLLFSGRRCIDVGLHFLLCLLLLTTDCLAFKNIFPIPNFASAMIKTGNPFKSSYIVSWVYTNREVLGYVVNELRKQFEYRKCEKVWEN
jgi:hypothetical protein